MCRGHMPFGIAHIFNGKIGSSLTECLVARIGSTGMEGLKYSISLFMDMCGIPFDGKYGFPVPCN